MNTKTPWLVEVPHILLLTSMFVVAAMVWSSLPNVLPVHWTGLPPAIPWRADGYGGKVQALLLWPTLTVAMYFLLLSAPRWSDQYEDGEASIGFQVLRISTTALLASYYFALIF